MGLNKQQLTDIQTLGIRWFDMDEYDLNRKGGAGPTDHKAFNFTDQTTMVPIFNDQVKQSNYSATYSENKDHVLIYENEKLVDKATIPAQPNFYKLKTKEGIPYSKIATLHSKNVLATTVFQKCVRYGNRETSCQFCAIEESLKSGATIAHKKPDQLVEVVKAAIELDGITQMIMTTGTPNLKDRGAKMLLESATAVKAAVDIPLQVQCEPPEDDFWFQALKDVGVDAIGMHLEAVSQRVREAIMPGKASVPMSRYISAYKAAVKVFGRGNVSTYILAGLGDTEEEIISVSTMLIDLGVYPFVVPFTPVAGTPLENYPMPDPEMLKRIFSILGPILKDKMMTSDSLKAGCAKCGACSSMKSYE
jgi:radical SAM protein (TIGR04043 family)